jgi:hypothetical protein
MVREQGKMGRVLMVGISIMIIALSGLNGTSSVWARSVKAYVDRNPVMADETLQLIVETEKASSKESPEWHVLDANFEVLSTTQSQQTSIINMRTTSLVRWMATLAPKRTGELTIPPIRVGAQQSDPIQLRVQEPEHARDGNESREIFLEAEVDTQSPYLQGQVLLTLRLVSAISVQEGRLDEPELEWGIVERVGEDVAYESTRNGRRYHMTERRYVISPQHSGTHVIPPVLFSGTIRDGRSRGSLFEELFGNPSGHPGRDPFQRSRAIHRRSQKIVLTVKDLPPDVTGRVWLPAKELTLTETWSDETDTLQIGDSLTRTVVMRAKGQRGEQLPELTVPNQGIVKVYSDRARTDTEFDGTWILGTREDKFVVVPTKAGQVTLPAIHVPWWNVETTRWEEARLPAKVLTVQGTSQPVLPDREAPSVAVSPAPPEKQAQRAISSTMQTMGPQSDSWKANPWPWMAGGCLMLWLVTLAAWWRDRQRKEGSGGAKVTKDNKKLESERKAIQGVKAACLEQSAEKTRTALFQWASVKQGGRPCRSLGLVAKLLSQPVQDRAAIAAAIWGLDRTLYTASVGQQSWDGRQFWETVQPAMRAKPSKANKSENGLPPLYFH